MRAETLREEIANFPLPYRGADIGPITASLGVATWPHHGEDGDALVRSADLALYDAKRAGRNRVATAPMPDLPALAVSQIANDQTRAAG